jgi:hypothetical protein
MLKETNSVLDQQCVKLRQQVEQLRADIATKSSLLESKGMRSG